MKKIISLFVAIVLVTALVATVSAETRYLADEIIPFAKEAPTLDGVLDKEWKNAAKFKVNASNAKIVAGTYTAGNEWTTYVMYDKENLYLAYEVKNANKGVLYFGNSGDLLDMYFDINGLGAANGDLNMHNFMTRTIAVTQTTNGTPSGAKDEITGWGVSYTAASAGANAWTDIADNSNVLAHGGAAGTQASYVIEQKISWADYKTMFEATYPGVAFPKIGEGTILTFMPSYYDCDATYVSAAIGNGLHTVWWIGQNIREDVPFAAAVPSCYGFRGTLGAPSTADYTAVVAVVAACAAAVVFAASKKH